MKLYLEEGAVNLNNRITNKKIDVGIAFSNSRMDETNIVNVFNTYSGPK